MACAGFSGRRTPLPGSGPRAQSAEQEETLKTPIPKEYVDKFSLSSPYDIQGLINNLEGVASTRLDQGKAEGLSAGRIACPIRDEVQPLQ